MLDAEQIVALQQAVRRVAVDESINAYLLDIVDATRDARNCAWASAPASALCLYRASQALALIENRDFVIPDDVKRLAVPVLSHRVIAKGYAQGTQRQTIEAVIGRLVDDVPRATIAHHASSLRYNVRRGVACRRPTHEAHRWLDAARLA